MKRWLKYLRQQWEMVLVLTVLIVGTAVLSIWIERRIRVMDNKIDQITQQIINRTPAPTESAKRIEQTVKSNSHEGSTP